MLLKFFLLILGACSLALGRVTGEPFAEDDKPKQPNTVILEAVRSITNMTRKLDVLLQQWDGALGGAFKINTQTNAIMSAIREGTKHANESRQLHVGGALKLGRATKQMIRDTRNVTLDLMYMKERFRVLTLMGVVRANLKKIQAASDKMNEVVVQKLPPVGRPIGRRMGRKVHQLFQAAIDEYSSKGPAPIPPPPKKTKTKHGDVPAETGFAVVGGDWEDGGESDDLE